MKSIKWVLAAAALVTVPLVVLAMPGHQQGKAAGEHQHGKTDGMGMAGGQGMSGQMGPMHGRMHAQMEKMHQGMPGAMFGADCHGAAPKDKPAN